MLREADCKHQALDGNSKILYFTQTLMVQSFKQKKKVGEKISRLCRTVFEISKHLLMPWQTVLGQLKFICSNEIQR